MHLDKIFLNDVVDLDNTIEKNIKNLSEYKNKKIEEINSLFLIEIDIKNNEKLKNLGVKLN